MPIKRPGLATWTIVIRTPCGAMRRSTGTTDLDLAREMETLVRKLRARRQWTLLNALIDNRVTLGELYDADKKSVLARLRSRLDGKCRTKAPNATMLASTSSARIRARCVQMPTLWSNTKWQTRDKTCTRSCRPDCERRTDDLREPSSALLAM
jgi:hypothetical protein